MRNRLFVALRDAFGVRWLRKVKRQRLDPTIFHLPVDRMKQGYYSDKYFVRARDVLLADGHSPSVLMQVFGKAHAFLGGVDEAIAILKLCADSWGSLEMRLSPGRR
jgi:nicotinate phosphoribosyltransferase